MHTPVKPWAFQSWNFALTASRSGFWPTLSHPYMGMDGFFSEQEASTSSAAAANSSFLMDLFVYLAISTLFPCRTGGGSVGTVWIGARRF